MFEHSHPATQMIAATTTLASIAGILPLLCAIPAGLFYCILLYEKLTGKNLRDLWAKK